MNISITARFKKVQKMTPPDSGEKIDELIIEPRKTPIDIYHKAFRGLMIDTLRVRGDIGVIGLDAFSGVGLKKVVFEGGYIVSVRGCAFSHNKLDEKNVTDIIDHILVDYDPTAFDHQFDSIKAADKITNHSFVVTGALRMGSRGDVEAYIAKRGGVVKNKVTKDTDYLVTNHPFSTTTKMKDAGKYGTKIISEDVLLNMDWD